MNRTNLFPQSKYIALVSTMMLGVSYLPARAEAPQQAPSATTHERIHAATEGLKQETSSSSPKNDNGKSTEGTKLEEAKDKASDLYEKGKKKAQAAANAAKEKTTKVYDSVKEKTKDTYEKAKDAVKEEAEKTKNKASAAAS